MKSFVLCLVALCLVLVLSVSTYACPVALQAAAIVQDHCAVQLNAAPVVAAPIVQYQVAPVTAAVVVPQVQYQVAQQAVVLQQNVHVKRQFRTPVRDFIQDRQNVRAQRQAVRAASKAAFVVHPQAVIVAPY